MHNFIVFGAANLSHLIPDTVSIQAPVDLKVYPNPISGDRPTTEDIGNHQGNTQVGLYNAIGKQIIVKKM